MTETVLITGGAGFVGLNLAEALVQRGCEVVVYDRRPPPAPVAGARVVTADVLDLAALDAAIGDHGVTRLVHAAAMTPGPEREMQAPEAVIDVNLRAAASLARLGHRHGCTRLLLVGSAAVYGGTAGPTLDEDTPTRPDTLYGITKTAAEQALRVLGARYGLPVVIARMAWVFGPWEHASGVRDTLSPVLQVTRLARDGRPARLPRPDRRDWIYSRDAAEALARLLLASRPRHDLYCLGTAGGWTLADWCALLAERHPGFAWSVGDAGPGTPVMLHTDSDGGSLSAARFAAEFGPVAGHGLVAAFEDYMAWLDQEDVPATPQEAP
ncbi:MAG: NAD(P)-dependent oxidoreductase [Azospirillaceae bacterium]